jgi:TonB-dependent SusC/RagA subfamily outer membrane receptor
MTTGIRVVGASCMCLAVAGCGGSRSEQPAPAPSVAAADSPPSAVRAGNAAGDRAHYESVIEMIRGKAPGLQVIEVSPGRFEVRIRGVHQSLQATGQEPLVVLDGMASTRPAGELLMALNPQDVVSIQVLKDVSSTAVYGTRGANGVLIVQTKRRR